MTTIPEFFAIMMPLFLTVFALGIAYLAHRSARAHSEPVQERARRSRS